MKPYIDYDESLLKSLKQPKAAAAYLNAALEENNPSLILTAYYNVARAHGVKMLADRAKEQRAGPEWKSLCRVLAAAHLQMRVSVCP